MEQSLENNVSVETDTMTTDTKHRIERMMPGISGNFFGLAGTVRRYVILVSVVLIPMFLQASPYQKQEQKAKDPPSKLSDEEKEIINNREMLEILPLLQNLERIEFIDLLNKMEPDWSESEKSDGPEEKKKRAKSHEKICDHHIFNRPFISWLRYDCS